MLRFVMSCGIFVWPLALLAAVIIILSILRTTDLFSEEISKRERGASGLHTILFWGAFSATLGIFAQILALYRAFDLTVGIVELSPTRLAMGFADSFAPTVLGLINLMISALIWFALRSRACRLSAAARNR